MRHCLCRSQMQLLIGSVDVSTLMACLNLLESCESCQTIPFQSVTVGKHVAGLDIMHELL